jgi:hypothetical protein
MQQKTTSAGGCFLMATIMLGFLAGLSIRNPLLGTEIGTLAGIVIAVVLWLVDRRRNG